MTYYMQENRSNPVLYCIVKVVKHLNVKRNLFWFPTCEGFRISRPISGEIIDF